MAELYFACIRGDIESVKNLIKYNVIENVKRSWREGTALSMASYHGHFEIVKLLVMYDSKIIIEDTDVLLYACLGRNTSIIKYLIHNGANVNICDDRKYTPLHLICKSHGNIEIAKLILQNGGDPLCVNWRGYTARNITINEEIKTLLQNYENIYNKEWRPWNHSKYPSKFQIAIKTLALIAKL